MSSVVNGIFTKEDVMNGVKWFSSKSCHRRNNEADVTVSKHAEGYGFIFRNGCEKKMGTEGKYGRVEFGFIRPGIIAFRTSPNGYTFNKRSKTNAKYISVRNRKGEKTFDAIAEYIGDYDLEYDRTFGLCYINLENRK